MSDTPIPPENLAQFQKDVLGNHWIDLESALASRLGVNSNNFTITGEDYVELEPEEQASLLREAGLFLGTLKPIDTELLASYRILIDHISLPLQEKERLLQIPFTDCESPRRI